MSSNRVLFACACLGLLVFGITLTTLGAVLPAVIEQFGIEKSDAGALFLLLTAGILGGSLVFGPTVDRYGYKWLLLGAMALVAIGLEGIAFAPSLWLLRTSIVLIGFGGGVINGAANALVADISAGERGANLNLLGVFFGVGAMGVPLGLALLGGRFTHAALIAGVGALVVVSLAFIVVTTFPAPKQPQGFPLVAAGGLVRDPVLLLMGFMLFLQSGLEITVGGWTSTFVSEELVIGGRGALFLLSLYWMGMMLARVAVGYILRRTAPFPVLYACLVIALSGSAMLLTTRSVPVAAVGVFLLGAGFAAMFPTVLGFIGDRYATLSGTAFSIAIVMALTGGMMLPYAAGIVGGSFGMRASFLIVPLALLSLAALLQILARGLRTSPPA